MRDPLGFIVLDDPVVVSDEGHVETFSHSAVRELIETEQQVNMSTYDNQLGKSAEKLYSHPKPGDPEGSPPAPSRPFRSRPTTARRLNLAGGPDYPLGTSVIVVRQEASEINWDEY